MVEGALEGVDEVLDVLIGAAAGRYDRLVPQPSDRGTWSAICAGINIALEELQTRIVELEEADRRNQALLAELERSRETIIAAEKLAAVGKLAAVLSHEVKNPLTSVLLCLGEIEHELETAETLQDARTVATRLIADATLEAERIDTITRQVFGLVRRGEENGPAAVSLVLDRAVRLSGVARPGVSVEVEVDGDPTAAMGEASLLQVVLNLLHNARDAFGLGGGRIWITSSEHGARVRISVQDDGPGVPPAIRDEVFTPFMTTKAAGEGLGVGLHVARQAAEAAGGTLRLEQPKAGGARFVLDVPAAPE